MDKISAVGIKELWYTAPESITADITGATLSALLKNANTKKVKNIHQDTWTLEESEASQDSYRNQLTGSIYRMGVKTMGDVTVNFTIGQYDYETKAEFLGGTTIKESTKVVGWKRPRGAVEKHLALIAKTQDNQYCVLPYCNIAARETNSDGAIGLGIVATAMEPTVESVATEYWFDSTELVTAAG